MRRSPLRRFTALPHGGPLRPVSKRNRERYSNWVVVRDQVLQRANYRCQAGCGRRAVHVHHVLPRSRGGRDDGSTPLMAVCWECHRRIHDEPWWSVPLGYLAGVATA